MFKIGFPVTAGENSYIVVTNLKRARQHICTGCEMSTELVFNSGAKFVWERSLDFHPNYRFEFTIFPDTRRTSTMTPNSLFGVGNSDGVACALAVEQNKEFQSVQNSPLVLVSCSFPPHPKEQLFEGIKLDKVTKSNDPSSLVNKWNAACENKAIALVLYETDAQMLRQELLKKEIKNITLVSLDSNTFKKISQRTQELPTIVSCKEDDFPLLKEALGIKPKLPKFSKIIAFFLLVLAIILATKWYINYAEFFWVEIEGPFYIGDPVHESFSAVALFTVGLIPTNSLDDVIKEYYEFIFGSTWNDDPEGHLFHCYREGNNKWSSVIIYLLKFKEYKNRGDVYFQTNDPLLARVHFGDLVFLHARRSFRDESPEDTIQKIMMWGEFIWKIVSEEISGETKIRNVPKFSNRKSDDFFSKLFREDHYLQEKTINELFLNGSAYFDVRKRAIGSLLHLIQDSYCLSHVQRTNDGKIRKFNYHGEQYTPKQLCGWQSNTKGRWAKMMQIPFAQRIIDDSVQILVLYRDKKNWESVESFLLNNVFKLTTYSN